MNKKSEEIVDGLLKNIVMYRENIDTDRKK